VSARIGPFRTWCTCLVPACRANVSQAMAPESDWTIRLSDVVDLRGQLSKEEALTSIYIIFTDSRTGDDFSARLPYSLHPQTGCAF